MNISKYIPTVILALVIGSSPVLAEPYVQADVGVNATHGQPSFGGRLGYGLEGGFRVESSFFYTDRYDTKSVGVNGYYDFAPANKVVPFVGVGTGYTWLNNSSRYSDNFNVSAHLGLRVNLEKGWAISGQYTHTQSVKNNWNNDQFLVGLRKSF